MDQTNQSDRAGPDALFAAIERARGRLHALDYATHGLRALTGADAACLSWIIADVLRDVDVIAEEATRIA